MQNVEHGPVALEGHRLDCSTSWTYIIFLKETLAFVPQQDLSPEQPPANRQDLAPIRSFAFPFTYILKAGSYVTGTSLTFATYAKMTLSFTFPCFCLSSAGITDTVSSYLTVYMVFTYVNPRLHVHKQALCRLGCIP